MKYFLIFIAFMFLIINCSGTQKVVKADIPEIKQEHSIIYEWGYIQPYEDDDYDFASY